MPKWFVLLWIGLLGFSVDGKGADMIKEPNVAGSFYSANSQELADSIDRYQRSAGRVVDNAKVSIAIAPHAGYIYSGLVAAHTFKAIARNHYKTIVIIAPSHYFPFEGVSVWEKGGFRTPLGILPIDEEFAKALLKINPQEFRFLPDVYEREHAVEVELPFLQKTFKDIHIVPILMGNPDFQVCHDLAVALNQLTGHRDDVLVLVSSDMSHYYPADTANAMDSLSLQAIQGINPKKFFEGCMGRRMEMCGFAPVTTALILAQLKGIGHVEVLKHLNSGDVTGDYDKVVGYGSVIFYSGFLDHDSVKSSKTSQAFNKFSRMLPDGALKGAERKELLKIARGTLEVFVRTGRTSEISIKSPRLSEVQGAFVTLRKAGALRGCIGNMIGQAPLDQTVRDMTVAAASEDPRFNPVSVNELRDIDLEISVLSKPRRIKDASEIVLGKHGVIISGHGRQGIFLPQVADETGWSKEEFLSQLCAQKAGLPSDCWKSSNVSLFVFEADVFGERDTGAKKTP